MKKNYQFQSDILACPGSSWVQNILARASALQSVAVRQSDGNEVNGSLFLLFSHCLYFSFSQIKSCQLFKKPVLDPFPIGTALQAARECPWRRYLVLTPNSHTTHNKLTSYRQTSWMRHERDAVMSKRIKIRLVKLSCLDF